MKKTFSSKKSAFSLIELSIVLIVIGLLIAGITGGASLIKSSELRSVMGEARGYAVAVNAFYTQFNNLPGDFKTSLGASDVAGNEDNKIQFFNSNNDSEGSEAWRDLAFSGAIEALPEIAEATVKQVPGTNIPASKVKSAGWVFSYNGTQNIVALTGSTVAASDNTESEISDLGTAALIPSDALSIDTKIDDGFADSGKIRGVNDAVKSAEPDPESDDPEAVTCNSSATYTVAETTKACMLSYQVDVNS